MVLLVVALRPIGALDSVWPILKFISFYVLKYFDVTNCHQEPVTFYINLELYQSHFPKILDLNLIFSTDPTEFGISTSFLG